ncbi:MAG: hypothetical protein ACYTF1_18850 [Planctomycetota bacterium]|jgi:hypothetical protein
MYKGVTILVCCIVLLAFPVAECVGDHLPEPTFEIACRWWPEFENVWTPVGWKDHFLRFNVIYNGTVVVEPRHKPHRGMGVQLTFIPSADDRIPEPIDKSYSLVEKYGPVGNQGWQDRATPVLWTEWGRDGFVLRKEIFGHVAGAGPVGKEVEPLYGWIRLSIREVPTNGQGKYYWLIKINRPHFQRSMWRQKNLVILPEKSLYPGGLKLDLPGDVFKEGCRLIEKKGQVRLGVAAGVRCKVEFIDRRPEQKDAYLRIEMPSRKGAYVDLLVPVLPTDGAAFDAELNLGLDKALAQSDGYWSQIPETASRVTTPEGPINEAIKHSLKILELLALRIPGSGHYCQMSGSWHYEPLWVTPTSMTHTMILDLMGYHSVSEKYLEVFRENQGKRVPPGDLYKKHPGYLSTPNFMAAIDWLSDHGAILHAVCNHGLMTDDKKFIDRWLEAIIKACEFTRDHIAMTGHSGVEGILPPAIATDRRIQIQAVWNDGWHYKGLTSAVRLLQRVGHPRGGEFAEVARAYKEVYGKAFREAARNTKKWIDGEGKKHHYVPTALPDGGDTVFPFYLDTGPLFLVYGGLMEASDPLMKSAVKYFREGPNTKVYDINGAWDIPVCLHHETSSCEPIYSWNVFHSHQLGDRYKFLEGMYTAFAGTLSRQTYIGCEHRGGISGTSFSAPLAVVLARLAVIDDQVKPGELHLLRLVPLAWLSTDQQAVFDKMPTEFGPMGLRFKLLEGGKKLAVDFEPKFRRPPKRIVVHVPPLKGLQELTIDGRTFTVKPGDVLRIK